MHLNNAAAAINIGEQFLNFIEDNQPDKALKLFTSASLEEKREMMEYNYFSGPFWAMWNGYTEVVRATLAAAREVGVLKELISENNYGVPRFAMDNGDVVVVKEVFTAAREIGVLKELLVAANYEGPCNSMRKGHIEVVKEVIAAAREVGVLKELFSEKDYRVTKWTISGGNAAVVEEVLEAARECRILKDVLQINEALKILYNNYFPISLKAATIASLIFKEQAREEIRYANNDKNKAALKKLESFEAMLKKHFTIKPDLLTEVALELFVMPGDLESYVNLSNIVDGQSAAKTDNPLFSLSFAPYHAISSRVFDILFGNQMFYSIKIVGENEIVAITDPREGKYISKLELLNRATNFTQKLSSIKYIQQAEETVVSENADIELIGEDVLGGDAVELTGEVASIDLVD